MRWNLFDGAVKSIMCESIQSKTVQAKLKLVFLTFTLLAVALPPGHANMAPMEPIVFMDTRKPGTFSMEAIEDAFKTGAGKYQTSGQLRFNLIRQIIRSGMLRAERAPVPYVDSVQPRTIECELADLLLDKGNVKLRSCFESALNDQSLRSNNHPQEQFRWRRPFVVPVDENILKNLDSAYARISRKQRTFDSLLGHYEESKTPLSSFYGWTPSNLPSRPSRLRLPSFE